MAHRSALIVLLVLGLLTVALGAGCGRGDSDGSSNDPMVVLRPEGRPEVSVQVELRNIE